MIIRILSVILVLISAFIAIYSIRQSPNALVEVTDIKTAAETGFTVSQGRGDHGT